ncbi:MAG: M6 family metalloprotease domain-containing protein [Methanococcaceae archaeon]
MRRIIFFAAVLFLAVFCILAPSLKAQMPPHPKLLQKIQSGEIQMPGIFTSAAANGIDAPWVSAELEGLNKSSFNSSRRYGPAAAPQGKWNLLALPADFADKPGCIKTNYFDRLLFSSAQNSLKKYFLDISYGGFEITTQNPPSSLNWMRAKEDYSFYIGGGDNGAGGYPNNCQKLAEDIIEKADPDVDFSKYDNDNDGILDALIIVHSGCGAEFSGAQGDIWSHSRALRSPKYCDGIKITRYAVVPEYYADSTGDMTIGVFAHELGHLAFGLPDLYDTGNKSAGLGCWSLMASGSWNGFSPSGGDSPAQPDAWSRIQMGFAQPSSLTANSSLANIHDIESVPEIYRLGGGGLNNTKEYFLVENRQKEKSDSCLPAGGLLIYHVDESRKDNNSPFFPGHNTSGHYLVSLMQADNKWELEQNLNRGNAGDIYPATDGNNNFAFNSSPGSNDYKGNDSGISVLNISKSSSVMSAGLYINSGEAASAEPQAGDLIFTQVGATDPDRFEFMTLKKLNLTKMKITDRSLDAKGKFATKEGVIDLSQAKYSVLADVPAGTFVRFEKDSSNDDTNDSDRILTFYFSSALSLSTSGDQIIAYKGSDSIPVFIAAVNFANSGWIKSDTANSNKSYAPGTPSDISLGSKDNYRFKGNVSGTTDATRDSIKKLNNWEGSATIYNFTLKNIGNALLPVELGNFEAIALPHSVLLRWHTITEINNSGWDIERKVYGEWCRIAFINGKGNSNVPFSYEYEDISLPSAQKVSYRLKQIDVTGGWTYSKTIDLDFNHHGNSLNLRSFPNPFNSGVKIRYSLANSTCTEIKIFNVLGQELYHAAELFRPAGDYTFELDERITRNLPGGVYFLRIITTFDEETIKLVYLK